MCCGFAFSMERYVPLGVSLPGRPVLMGHVAKSLRSLKTFMLWPLALATTISERPILKSCRSVCVAKTPGESCTPSRWPTKLTLVFCGQ